MNPSRPVTATAVESSVEPSPEATVEPATERTAGSGFTLVDLLLALAIVGTIVVLTVPSLDRATAAYRLRLAATEASRILLRSRSYAVRHSAHVGVKFHPGERGRPTTWSLHVDGDGDGVRSRDVDRGVDPPVPALEGTVRRDARFGHGVVPGFPAGPLPRDPSGRPLGRREDPIRFNRSDLAVFTPLGTATPGTLYLTDGRGLAAVRVNGRTGRVRTLLYDPATAQWR